MEPMNTFYVELIFANRTNVHGKVQAQTDREAAVLCLVYRTEDQLADLCGIRCEKELDFESVRTEVAQHLNLDPNQPDHNIDQDTLAQVTDTAQRVVTELYENNKAKLFKGSDLEDIVALARHERQALTEYTVEYERVTKARGAVLSFPDYPEGAAVHFYDSLSAAEIVEEERLLVRRDGIVVAHISVSDLQHSPSPDPMSAAFGSNKRVKEGLMQLLEKIGAAQRPVACDCVECESHE